MLVYYYYYFYFYYFYYISIVFTLTLLITSPAGAVAKYCNERVCVCVCVCVSVCLSASISSEPYARSLPFLCMLPITVARCSSGEVTKSQGKGAILGVFFPTDSMTFGTHRKMAEPIEMPFGLMTRAGPKYHVLDGGPDPPREGEKFGGKRSGPL